MTTSPVWASIDLAATAIALAAMITLHVLPTDLSAWQTPVSQYGITPYRAGYRVLTIALGVAGLAAAAGVSTTFPAPGRAGIVTLLVVFGLCRLVISWAPMDPPGRPRSNRGAVHVAMAIGAFLASALAANRMYHAVARLTPPDDAYSTTFQIAFWLIVIGLVGQFLAGRNRTHHRFYGAAERIVYAGIYLLLAATGIVML